MIYEEWYGHTVRIVIKNRKRYVLIADLEKITEEPKFCRIRYLVGGWALIRIRDTFGTFDPKFISELAVDECALRHILASRKGI